MSAAHPRVGFVLEKALGHATHADNMARIIGLDDRIRAEFAPIEYEENRRWSRVPGYGNWTVRAGIRARRAVRAMQHEGQLDALFVHTQVPAMLMPDRLRRIPSIVSLDATPIQYDQFGELYDHAVNGEKAERFKFRVHRACFSRASRLVAWSEWAKMSLVEDYGVPAEKVVVIAPGVDYARWATIGRTHAVDQEKSTRVLFVGGDFARKGGHVLVDAIRRLRADGTAIELDVVTRDDVPTEAGVTVHRGVTMNSPELIALYHSADVFCLPTLGDCLAIVLSEAGAAGLPLVATHVGATKELVQHERTGLVVPPGNDLALATALGRLAGDPVLRRRLGDAAQRLARTEFDAVKNAGRLVDLLVDLTRGETL